MKKHQRILSLLLCLVMLVGILPVSAYAANATAFSDVKTTDWFCEAVEYVSGADLMSGTGFGRFSPNEQTTRGMIVTILYRLSGSPAVTGTCTFTDVAAGKYYEKPIIWAAANGIVTGTGKDTFSPDAPITREQLAAILYRYARFCGYDVSASNSLDSFTDAASVGSYALEAMKWANAAGLINGSNGALRPKGNATRAEVAAILMRFCKNVAKTADSKPGSTGTITTPVNPSKPDEPDKPDQPDNPDQPDQPAVKGNDAYDLIWDDFLNVSANNYSVKGFSSWDCSNAMAKPAVANGGASYTDNSKYAGLQLRRAFNATSDDLVWEFTWKAPATLVGTTIELRSGETTAICFTMDANGKMSVGGGHSCDIFDNRFALLRVSLSPKNGTYSVEADGQTVAENLPFLNTCTSVDNIYIQTTDEATGTFTLSTVRMYVGYVLHEQFLNADQGTIPASWTVSGDVRATYQNGTQGPDKYSAQMKDGAKLSRGVSYSDSGAWLEYQLLIPETMDSFAAVLADEAGNSFKIAVENGAFGYYKDGTFQKLYECQKNLWYHIMFKQTPQGGMLYLNHKLKAEKIALPFEKFTTITFEAGTGTAYLDDIILKDYSDYASDYVPEPVKPEKEEGTPLVGLQSCNLWVEGQHFGYDWLTQWDERTPYLGYYDETSVETADWELKWKIEHGIDFELFCWYRMLGSNDTPIKTNRNGTALHEGYFNAKYSDQMKFAITWECAGGPVSGSKDFRENVVPYWIEQYFKDERYLLIDNKPVLGMYSVNKLMSYFGSVDGVKAELEYLREACKKAGFDGCYIIMSNSDTSLINRVADAGFDGQYAYCWDNPADIDNQKLAITSFTEKAKDTSAPIIPVASMGWDARAWDRNGGGYCTVEDYQSLLSWISDELMPTLNSDSLGSKMVLLDNWNEYGEGHFLMPANLNGFGYVDAIRNVFTTGGTHTDVRPNAEQLERINRMYVQDRKVEKVTKDDGSEKEVISGWYFENDLEGWTVAKWQGNDMDVRDLQQKNGCMTGTAIVHAGDNPNYSDPALDPPENAGPWSANEVAQIRVRMKLSVATDAPELYFSTESSANLSQDKMVLGSYNQKNADADGFVDVIFDMTSSANWSGKITGFRLDPMTKPGSFEIDSVELLGKKDLSEAIVTMEGARIFTAEPVKLVNGVVLFPAADIDQLFTAVASTKLDGSAIEISVTKGKFYRFSCTANEMTADGVTTELKQGAKIIDGVSYIPLAALAESEGYEAKWNEETKTLAIAEAVDPNDPYKVIRAWYFTSDTEGWTQGGDNKVEWQNDTLHATAVDNNLRMWSPENLGVPASEVTHLRMRLRSNAANVKIRVELGLDNGSWLNFYQDYTPSETQYVEVLIPLTGLHEDAKIKKFGLYPFNGGGNATIGKEAWIDEIELVKYTGEPEQPENPDTPTEGALKGWYFTNDKETWIPGGLTGVEQENGALKLTVSAKGNMRAWSCNTDNTGKPVAPINVKAGSAKTLRMMVKNSTENQKMVVCVQLVDASGNTLPDAEYEVQLPVSDDYKELLIEMPTSTNWNPAATITRIGLYPFGVSDQEALAGKSVYFDCIEILPADEEPEETYEVLKAFTFDSSNEGWSGNYATPTVEDGCLKITTDKNGFTFWSSQPYPFSVNISDLTHLRIRINSTTTADNPVLQDIELVTELGTSVHIRTTPMTLDKDGWADILIDCATLTWPEGASKVTRMGVKAHNNSGEETISIDTVQFLKKAGSKPEQPEEPEIPDPTGGDDGTNEVADSSKYTVLFGSYYFKNGIEGFIPGGDTKLAADNGALKVTSAADGQPRFWSSAAANGTGAANAPLDVKATDLDYIRVRIKTTVPDQKMVITAEYFDGEQNKTSIDYKDLAVTASSDGYTEVLVDLSNYDALPEGLTLQRIGVFPFGKSNTKYANKTLYIGSIEFLKKADPTAEKPVKILVIGNSITQHAPSTSLGWLGNWGMAATEPSKDYVHQLLAKALEVNPNVELHCVNISSYEKYFYDWSQITTDFSKYVEYDADIIISTFGANVKNGSNEGDDGFENDKTFTKEHYKAIVDHFNPNGDAKVIAGVTTLTNTEISTVIEQAAREYGYSFVDMSDLTGDEYTAKYYAEDLKAKFGVATINDGVLKHPGNDGMKEMADRLWTTLNPLVKPKTETVLKAYTFEKNEGWTGNVATPEYKDGCLEITTTASNFTFWSSDNATYFANVDVNELTHIRIRIKSTTTAEKPVIKVLWLVCDDKSGEQRLTNISMSMGSDGWAEIMIDCTAFNWGDATKVTRIGFQPYNGSGEAETITLDKVEFLNIS